MRRIPCHIRRSHGCITQHHAGDKLRRQATDTILGHAHHLHAIAALFQYPLWQQTKTHANHHRYPDGNDHDLGHSGELRPDHAVFLVDEPQLPILPTVECLFLRARRGHGIGILAAGSRDDFRVG